MKALVKAEAKPGLWLKDVPEPAPHAGEVLIRVLRTGICGTDLHIRSWDTWAQENVKTPVVLGHEIAGTVEALGRGVDTVDVGDLIAGRGARLVDVHCTGTAIRDFINVADESRFGEQTVIEIFGAPPADAMLVFGSQ